jgi:hypothetical protein
MEIEPEINNLIVPKTKKVKKHKKKKIKLIIEDDEEIIVIKKVKKHKKKKIKLIIEDDEEIIVNKNTTNANNTFTILTEEVPSYDEITFMLNNILKIEKSLFEKATIRPNYINSQFKGEWEMQFDNYIIIIKLFKGETSCADYLLFNGYVNNNDASAENAICILESTKTNDTNSRNTSVNQRITKFMVYKKLYPNSKAKMVMFYNNKWDKKNLTDTGKFGLKLMKSLEIEAYHGENNIYENLYDLYLINKFTSIEEMISEKNKIKEKKGNVSVKITNSDDIYYISCKLDKGISNSSGKISHDPNVGLLSGLINFIHNNNNLCKIVIEKHNITQDYFNKLPKSKFWYAINKIDVEFSDVTIISKRPDLPNKYFTIENSCTEKISTILLSQIIDKKYFCIFSNHSGCALTNIKTNDKDIIVERTMPRPDILFYDKTENTLLIVEGKIEKDIQLGINQLQDSNLERFIQLIKLSYPDSIIKKGLCITIDDISNINKYSSIQFPILFAIDLNGLYYYNV